MRFVLFFFTIFTIPAFCKDYDYYFSTHSNINIGPTDHLSLAGATVALPENTFSFYENPASVPFQPYLIFGSFSSARINDYATINPKQINSPIQLLSGGLSVNLNWTAGLTGGLHSTSRSYKSSFDNVSYSFESTSSDIPLSIAYRPIRSLSFALSYIYFSEDRVRDNSRMRTSTFQTLSGSGFKISSIYALNQYCSLALTARKDAKLTVKTEADSNLSGGQVPSLKPWIFQTGIVYYLLADKSSWLPFDTTLFFEVDHVNFYNISKDKKVYSPFIIMNEDNPRAFVLSSPDNQGNEVAEYDLSPKWIPKAAFEMMAFSMNDVDIYWRLGTYYEPKTLRKDSNRTHLTTGIEVQYSAFLAKVGFDFAKDYFVYSYAFGLSF